MALYRQLRHKLLVEQSSAPFKSLNCQIESLKRTILDALLAMLTGIKLA